MKKFIIVLAAVFCVSSIIGCGKKKAEEVNLEDLNGVSTDNLVSVSDQSYSQDPGSVPVIVENDPGVESLENIPVAVDIAVTDAPSATQIQQALKNAGLYTGKVDGKVGPRTKRAIEAFQSQNGLKADGKVGRKTWKLLGSFLNKAGEVTNPSAEQQAFGQ